MTKNSISFICIEICKDDKNLTPKSMNQDQEHRGLEIGLFHNQTQFEASAANHNTERYLPHTLLILMQNYSMHRWNNTSVLDLAPKHNAESDVFENN